MSDTEQSDSRPRRDPAFFVSDARGVAEDAAYAMQAHGPLHPSMRDALASAIEECIGEWFEDNVWDEG